MWPGGKRTSFGVGFRSNSATRWLSSLRRVTGSLQTLIINNLLIDDNNNTTVEGGALTTGLVPL